MSEEANHGAADQAVGEISTLLGEGAEFSGKLSFEGTVRIDGRFSGEIVSEGTLVIGSSAELRADIAVDTVLIQGRVEGDVTASRCIELHAPARVTGRLSAPELLIDRGVIFDGECQMSAAAGAPATDTDAVAPADDEGSEGP